MTRGRNPGVWFFSLDAASRLAVAGARLGYHLPYFHARIAIEISDGPTISYSSRRLGSGQTAEFSGAYGPTGPAALAAVGSLEFFLAERYLLYAWNGHTLSSARVHHAPYPLQPAAAFEVRQSLTVAAGLPPFAEPPPLVHYAREVDVRIERPRRSGEADGRSISARTVGATNASARLSRRERRQGRVLSCGRQICRFVTRASLTQYLG